MEELNLLYNDIYVFFVFILMILFFVATLFLNVAIIFNWFLKRNLKEVIEKEEKNKAIKTLAFRGFFSFFSFVALFIYLSIFEIEDVQYKNILDTFASNNAIVKSKILNTLEDGLITKKEYISIFFGIDEIQSTEKTTFHKEKTLRIINNHKM